MTAPFASISIHSFVDKVGAYCGLGAIIGLAVLILLFFSHARELANLRARLGEAQERVSALEGRIVQLLRAPAPRAPVQPAQPPVAPVTAGARAPMGTAAASVRRAANGPAAAEAPPAPFAPAGTGAPALASATRLIGAELPRRGAPPRRAMEAPVSAPPPAAVPAAGEDTVLVPAAAATAAAASPGAGNGRGRAAAAVSAAPPPTRTRPPAAPVRGAGGRGTPPRVQMRDGQPAPAAPAGRRGQGPPSLQQPTANHSARRRILSGLAGLVVVAAIVVALLVVTNNGGTTKSNVAHPGEKTTAQTNSGSKSGGGKGKKHKTPPVKPSSVTVAVLNGTAVAGLAGDVSDALTKKGYLQGPVTNAAVQTQSHTEVAYLSNNVRAANAVAKSLGLPLGSVQKASETTIQSCGTPATSTGTTTSPGSCGASVIVTVGSDKASLASSGTSTSP